MDYRRWLFHAERLADRDRSRHEFTRPFLGGETLPKQLEEYIASCAQQWADEPGRFEFPVISIVQSSGFGKSRLLRELANRTKDDPHGAMKVLYTCVRAGNVEDSTAYPQATVHLREYLFPTVDWRSEPYRDHHAELGTKLFHLFDFAVSQWDSIGTEWFSLFDDQADTEIYRRLATHMVKSTKPSQTETEAPRILVLAIDEARTLLATTAYDENGWFRRLCSALVTVAAQIHATYGPSASLFAVLVDTSPATIARYAAPELVARESWSGGASQLFPPFVLTHTMDVRFNELIQDAQHRGISSIQFYQSLVGCEGHDAWCKLVLMGRPVWDHVKRNNWSSHEEPSQVIQLAADLLLGGFRAHDWRSFKKDSLFGAASILCRLGLRPSSWSSLASRTVADFGSTLLHVSVSHDQLWTTYASEPVLTFGAARVWYQSSSVEDPHGPLAQHLLPQFRKLLSQELIETNGISPANLVGRIVLLLTMDAVGAAMVLYASEARYGREYAGDFYSVEAFLTVLYGDQAVLVRDCEHKDVTRTSGAKVQEWLQQWRGWKVGFSHFVQFTSEPTEHDLWVLLARRAAGVFPREHSTVDLFIPIFKGTMVSMILVQTVVHRPAGSVPHASMRPSSVFTNTFKELSPSDVVHVHINLRGAARKAWYLLDSGTGTNTDGAAATDSLVLYLDGLDSWSARPARAQQGTDVGQSIPTVSKGVAEELRKLLLPWWTLRHVVEERLGHGGRAFASAMRPLVDSLLQTDSSDEDLAYASQSSF